MLKVISAFARCEVLSQSTDGRVQGIFTAFTSCSQQGLDLGEYLFDGVELRAVRWQVELGHPVPQWPRIRLLPCVV